MKKKCKYCHKEYEAKRAASYYCNWRCNKKDYYLKNRTGILKKMKDRYENNLDYYREYNQKNKGKKSIYNKNYHQQHKDAIRIKDHKKYITSRIKINQRHRAYYHTKKNNPLFHFKKYIRGKILESFKMKNMSKCGTTEKILGCTIYKFKKYIEKQLPKNKTIKDIGNKGYHLHHIVPLESAKTFDDIVRLSHYTNLRPIWWKKHKDIHRNRRNKYATAIY